MTSYGTIKQVAKYEQICKQIKTETVIDSSYSRYILSMFMPWFAVRCSAVPYKQCIVQYYNMVGVAVAMVISTMHEKSCIDSQNARKFEKSSKIQSITHLAITVMKLRKYHNHEFLKLSYLYDAIIRKVISYKTEPEFLFELSLLSLKTIDK